VTNPRPLPPWLRAENPAAALDYEIAREKASALGRLGRRLEAALAALAAFDAQTSDEAFVPAAVRRERRNALVAEAGEVLWSFIVQREACGLRDSARAMRDYGVPTEVRLRMGIFPRSPKSRS
jgi:Family of unknown function (DUF6665)